MKVVFNKSEIELTGETYALDEFLALRQVPETGIAVAVNDRVVPKASWAATAICDGDKVTVITAVCGG